mmetsp:Transcript_32042/g.44679  ORF Transcript_32042/g.44679 Transcript_32042/m.44679 type:complete len:348 (-) Transcript_32042:215-1258(-)
MQHQADEAFDDVDLDKDGFVSRNDAMRAILKLYVERDTMSVDEATTKAFHHSAKLAAQSGEVSKEEFVLWWYEQFDKFGVELDVRYQRPPHQLRRLAALFTDFVVYALLPGVVLEAVQDFSLVDAVLSFEIDHSPIQIYSLLFHVRDSITSRSFGKYIWGLEIVQVERCHCPVRGDFYRTTEIPATKTMAFTRCIDNFLTMPFLSGANLALLLFSPTRRSIGDYLSGTMVVPEGPHYKRRVDRMRSEFPSMQFRSSLATHLNMEDSEIGSSESSSSSTSSMPMRRRVQATKYPSLWLVLIGGLLFSLFDDHIDISINIELEDDDDDSTFDEEEEAKKPPSSDRDDVL